MYKTIHLKVRFLEILIRGPSTFHVPHEDVLKSRKCAIELCGGALRKETALTQQLFKKYL